MNFFIKQNSTLPILKYPLPENMLDKLGVTLDMLENVAVTFSLINADTGFFEIANVPAKLLIISNRYELLEDEKYTLVYMFSVEDTSKTGNFIAEFKVDFMGDDCGGKITMPNDDIINVIISSSITKTTVV